MVSDELVPFLRRVIRSAQSKEEIYIVAAWVAEFCNGNPEALEYFKELCLTQLEELEGVELKKEIPIKKYPKVGIA